MEKLELKHLAPYLPYELKVKLNSELYQYPTIIGMVRDTIYLNYHGKGLSFIINNVKPILRPIEDLYNEKTDFGIKIVHYFNFKTNVKLDCRNFPYHVMEQLFKNHFDVFGLIPKGLAISYSDVQSTSNEG